MSQPEEPCHFCGVPGPVCPGCKVAICVDCDDGLADGNENDPHKPEDHVDNDEFPDDDYDSDEWDENEDDDDDEI